MPEQRTQGIARRSPAAQGAIRQPRTSTLASSLVAQLVEVEEIPVGIAEHRHEPAPGLLLRRHREVDSAAPELLVALLEIGDAEPDSRVPADEPRLGRVAAYLGQTQAHGPCSERRIAVLASRVAQRETQGRA